MTKKEQLRERIEEERAKLNTLLACGENVEETYLQSVVVDQLLEKYMEIDN